MTHNLWVIFMILYRNADMVMMEDGWLIWIEREIMSHSLAPSEISRKMDAGNPCQGSMDGRISPNCKMRYKDPRTADLVGIFKVDEGIHRPPIWSMFLKGYAGINGPPIWYDFSREMQGSTNRRIRPNFKKGIQGSKDGPIGPNFKRGKQGSTDRRFGRYF